jgi:hypothetical protein
VSGDDQFCRYDYDAAKPELSFTSLLGAVARSAIHINLDFSAADTKTVNTDLTFDGTKSSESDWLVLRVTSPNNVESSRGRIQFSVY